MHPLRTSAPYDLVICDIDGCLAPESATPLDVPSLAAIAKHNRAADERRDRPWVTACSGRPITFVEAICRLIHNTAVPAVGENGVWLYTPGINEFSLDPAIGPEHLEIVHQARRWVEQSYGPLGVSQQPGKTASVTLYHADTDVLRRIAPEVQAEFDRRGWPFRVSMTWLYINCDLAFISKANGVRRVLEQTGVPPERVAGIGDTLSDLPVAQIAGFFACPANAAEAIKERAEYISPYAEAAGVVDILGRLWPG